MKNKLKTVEFYKLSYFLKYLTLVLLIGTGCSYTVTHESSEEKPNIVLIMIDNVGYPEFGVNGNNLVKTPNIDHFATDGVQFERFSANPMCAPTRASLMTGRYFYRTGVIHTSRGGAKMHGDEVTIAELLKDEGYDTGVFGKWHLGNNYPMRPQDQGFDETLYCNSGGVGQVPDYPNTYIDPKLWENGQYVQKQGYCTDVFFNEAIHFIKKSDDRPFFIYLPTNIAHESSEVGPVVPEQYVEPYIAMGLNKNVAEACGMLNNLDENFGRLIACLDSLDLRDNTLVIFLSDDGDVRINRENYRVTGYSNPYEGSTKVPCFVQYPGHLKGGFTIDRIASHIDILPTILDITGSSIDSNLNIDGVSLLPLLEGKDKNWTDRMIFLQCSRGMTPHRYQNFAAVTQKFKLIGNPNSFEDRQFAKSKEKSIFELYDIPADPGESNNLSEQYPEELVKLRNAYDLWFDDVNASRQFSPGLIHLGNDAENPTYLCRYQDATYIDEKPTGWPVVIERAGKYEVTINRGGSLGKGQLCIRYDSTSVVQPLKQGESQAIFSLPEGKFNLNIWVKEEGKDYVPRPDSDLIGDASIRRLKE